MQKDGLGPADQTDFDQLEYRARQLRPWAETGDLTAMTALGEVTSRLGLFDEAERWLVASAKAGDMRAALELGDLLEDLHRTDEAEQWHAKAAGMGILALARFLQGQRRADEAEQWYRQPNRWTRHDDIFALASLLLRQGRLDEAERYCRPLAEQGDPDAMIHLADVLALRGTEEEAAQWRSRGEEQIEQQYREMMLNTRFGSAHPLVVVVTAAVVTTTVAPFVKAMVTKAGEDSYAAVRAALRRLFRRGRPTQVSGTDRTGQLLIVQDPDPALKLALHLGVDTPDEAIRALETLDLDAVSSNARRRKVQKVRLVWDEVSKTWKALDS